MPSHHARHDAPAQASHHFPGFNILLQQLIDLRNRASAAARNPLSPAAVQNLVVAPLLGRHGVDDRFDVNQFLFIDFHFIQSAHRPHVRQHPQDLIQRAHLPDLLQLVAKIVQREFVFADLLRQFGSLLLDRPTLRPSR